MVKTKIVVGQKYLITGSHGGCSPNELCKDCPSYQKGLIVTKINNCIGVDIEGKSLSNIEHCTFDSRDLTLKSWKARYNKNGNK